MVFYELLRGIRGVITDLRFDRVVDKWERGEELFDRDLENFYDGKERYFFKKEHKDYLSESFDIKRFWRYVHKIASASQKADELRAKRRFQQDLNSSGIGRVLRDMNESRKLYVVRNK